MHQNKITNNLFNRRYDDIVVIVSHEFKPNAKEGNKLYIEYLNQFAEKFLGLQFDCTKKILFNKIINRKVVSVINDFLEQESLNGSLPDLVSFFRKANNFAIYDAFGNNQLVNVKSFLLDYQHDVKKNIYRHYYYLIIRSLEIEIEFNKFKHKFFSNFNLKNEIDNVYGAHSMLSTINELKMLCAFKKKYISVPISIIILNIKDFYSDYVLIAAIAEIFSKNVRPDDFVGLISKSKVVIFLLNCSYRNCEKVCKRLESILITNSYVFDKYRNQIYNIFEFKNMELSEYDSYEIILKQICQ